MAKNYHSEARKVAGFDTSVITPISEDQKEYLKEYSKRLNDKDLSNNPKASENLKYFAHVMLSNANRFKHLAEVTEGEDDLSVKVRTNYEDVAEANWLAYQDFADYA